MIKPYIESALKRAEQQYDPEFDIPQGNQPKVSWVEMFLIQAVIDLSAEVDRLKAQIKADKARRDDYEDFVDTRRRQKQAAGFE